MNVAIQQEENSMNIVLIGMPGCGKSTVGVLLAKTMRLDFIDCDLIIQKQYGMSLQDIIDTNGLDDFLSKEEAALCRLEAEHSVIATGGSAVYSEKAMRHLKKNAVTVYISLPCDEIKRRLTNIKTRGVAMAKGETIESLYEKRCALYRKYADVTLNAQGLQLEETVERVTNLINSYCPSLS